MGCVLRIFGPDLNIDTLLKQLPFEPDHMFRKGEIGFGKKKRVCDYSGMNIGVSDADMDEFELQIKDAIGFLKDNEILLAEVMGFPGVAGAELDFGIEWRDVAAQGDYLPPELVKLAGGLGIGVMISHYPCCDE